MEENTKTRKINTKIQARRLLILRTCHGHWPKKNFRKCLAARRRELGKSEINGDATHSVRPTVARSRRPSLRSLSTSPRSLSRRRPIPSRHRPVRSRLRLRRFTYCTSQQSVQYVYTHQGSVNQGSGAYCAQRNASGKHVAGNTRRRHARRRRAL